MKINNKKVKKRYIVSSITDPAGVSSNFLRAIERAAKHLKADIELYPTKKFKKNHLIADERVEQYLYNRDRRFNKNLKVLNDLNANETTLDPATGIRNSGESYIIPHPTHRLKTLSRQIKISPHPGLITSTGSLNLANSSYSKKTEFKANQAHVTGALYIEVYNDKKFSLTQITWDGKGFYLMNKYYTPKKVKKIDILAMVLGDLHPGEHCPHNLKEVYRMFKQLRPKNVILHDWLNGDSVSHHTAHMPIHRSLNQQTLEEECAVAADLIGEIRDKSKAKVHLVASNHPEHIDRYLEEGRFMQDPVNLKMAAGLLNEVANMRCIYRYILKKRISLKNINILKREDTLNLAGFELSNHGDHGANGARGAKNVMGPWEIGGHVHTPEITTNGATFCGTSTHLTLGYTNPSGFSGWCNAHALVYPNGTRSLVFVVQ